jgi:hypothetical protein
MPVGACCLLKCELSAKNSGAKPSPLLRRRCGGDNALASAIDNNLWLCMQAVSSRGMGILPAYVMPNEADLSFSGAEAITLSWFGILDGKTRNSYSYKYAERHLRDWFPKLPGSTAFIQRLKRVADALAPTQERGSERIQFFLSMPYGGWIVGIELTL